MKLTEMPHREERAKELILKARLLVRVEREVVSMSATQSHNSPLNLKCPVAALLEQLGKAGVGKDGQTIR